MKAIEQTRFGGPNDPPEEQGNCWAACIASIAELPLESFPRPRTMEWDDYWNDVTGFLRSVGYGIVRFQAKANPWLKEWPGHIIACGKSPNGDWDHCVVFRAGELVHDPHPAKRGLVGDPHEYEAVVLL